MSGFKRATAQQREVATKGRSQKGLPYVKSDIPIFVPVDGDNQIRIVPPLATDKHATLWGLEVWSYYLNNTSFISSQTFDSNSNDPIRDHFFKIRESQPEEARKFRGVKRHLMFVLDLNDDAEELKLWAAPPTLIDDIVKLAKNRRTGELIPLEDPEEGRVVFFTKTGTGIGTKYGSIELDSKAFPLEEALADELELFEDLLVIPTESDMVKLLENSQNSLNDAIDDAPAPRRRRREPPQSVEVKEETVDDETPFEPDVAPAASEPEPEPEDMKGRVRDRLKARRNRG